MLTYTPEMSKLVDAIIAIVGKNTSVIYIVCNVSFKSTEMKQKIYQAIRKVSIRLAGYRAWSRIYVLIARPFVRLDHCSHQLLPGCAICHGSYSERP
jgi:hypothetical protein